MQGREGGRETPPPSPTLLTSTPSYPLSLLLLSGGENQITTPCFFHPLPGMDGWTDGWSDGAASPSYATQLQPLTSPPPPFFFFLLLLLPSLLLAPRTALSLLYPCDPVQPPTPRSMPYSATGCQARVRGPRRGRRTEVWHRAQREELGAEETSLGLVLPGHDFPSLC